MARPELAAAGRPAVAVALSLLAGACITLAPYAPNSQHVMSDTYFEPGHPSAACAMRSMGEGTMEFREHAVTVRACAVTRRDGGSLELVFWDDLSPAAADPGNWRVEVWGPSARRETEFHPAHVRSINASPCSQSGLCRRWAFSSAPFSWSPGRWRVHFTFEPDPRLDGEVTITLR